MIKLWIWNLQPNYSWEIIKKKLCELTAAKCPAVIERPMAKGTDPFTSDRRLSLTPCTTNTSINVMRASMRTAWPRVSDEAGIVTPKFPIKVSGVAA